MTYLRNCCPRGLTSLEAMIQDLTGLRLSSAATRFQLLPHYRHRSAICSRGISSSPRRFLDASATATEHTSEEATTPRERVKVPGTRKPLTLAKQAKRIRRKERRLAEGKYRGRSNKVKAQIEESKRQYDEGVAAKKAAIAMAREHLRATSGKKQPIEKSMNPRQLVESKRKSREQGRKIAESPEHEKLRSRTDKRPGRSTGDQSQKETKSRKDSMDTVRPRSSDQEDIRSPIDSSATVQEVPEEIAAIKDDFSTDFDSSSLLSSMMADEDIKQARLARISRRSSSKEETASARSSTLTSTVSKPPTKREPWQIQKKALERKFGDADWAPRKRISPDSLNGIRALHASDPEAYSTEVLARHFEMSPEAIRRILKSKWRPTEDEARDRQERWEKRGKKKWEEMAKQGIRPPARWRAMGVNWRGSAHKADRGNMPPKPWEVGAASYGGRKDRANASIRSPGAPGFAHRIM